MNSNAESANEYVDRDGSDPSYYFFLSASTAFGAAAPANFEQEWSKLITAAQQEGTLSIASGGAPSRQYRPVVDAFSKKFNIKVEVSTGNATDTVNRVLAERKGRQVHRRRGADQLARKSAALGAIRLAGAVCRRCCFIPTSSTLSKWYKRRHMYADKFGKFALIYHAGLEDQYESLVQHRENQRSGNRHTRQADRHFRSQMERQNRRPRHGRPIRHSPNDR